MRFGVGIGYKQFTWDYQKAFNGKSDQVQVQGFHPAFRISAYYPVKYGHINAHAEGYTGSKGVVYDWSLGWSKPIYNTMNYQIQWSLLAKGASIKVPKRLLSQLDHVHNDKRFSTASIRAGLHIEFR